MNGVAQAERQCEVVRQVLYDQPEFNILAAFRILDVDNQGSIGIRDLERFLSQSSLRVQPQELQGVLDNWDANQDGKISYSEFARWILPRALKQEKLGQSSIQLPYETVYALARVIQQEIIYFNTLTEFREELKNHEDFDISKAFQAIDLQGQFYIDRPSLNRFLQNNEYEQWEQEVESIFRRVDKDNDGRISYSEFQSFLSVQKPLYYSRSIQMFNSAQPLRSPRQSVIHGSQSQTNLQKSMKISELSKREKPRRLRNSQSTKVLEKSNEIQLIQIFHEQIQLDREIEKVRQELALRRDYNLISHFRQISNQHNRGQIKPITINQFKKYLQDLEIFSDQSKINLLFKIFDVHQQGRIYFENFCDIFTPKTSEYSKLINTRTGNIQQFSVETQFKIQKAIRMLLDSEYQIDNIRRSLAQCPHFQALKAFQSIDLSKKGYLTLNDFRILLRENDQPPTENDLMTIIQRYDHNGDGRISFKEFEAEITPRRRSLIT